MFIQLDFESQIPFYEQLKDEIIIGIAKNNLQPGDRLPSVRTLASDIGINLHTVNKAYQQLKQEGFLQIHRQRGVVIHPDGPPRADDTYVKELKTILKPILAEAMAKGMSDKRLNDLSEELYIELKEED